MVMGALWLVLIAFCFVIGAPILAVPIFLVGAVAIGALDFARRRKQAKQMHRLRDEAKADSVEFTDRDQETLVSE